MACVLKSYSVFFITNQKIVCSLILLILKKLCSLILNAVFYNLSSLFRFCCVRNYVLPVSSKWIKTLPKLIMVMVGLGVFYGVAKLAWTPCMYVKMAIGTLNLQ